MAEPSKELVESAKKYSEQYGIPTSVILAFAGAETSFGTAGMGKSKNNLFGIGNKSYASVDDSVKDFASLVTGNKDSAQSKKYGDAVKNAKSVNDWVESIRNAGYNSERSDYTEYVMSVYNSNNLSRYDSGNYTGGTVSEGSETSVKWWGKIVVVIVVLLVVIGGVIFLSMSIKQTTGVDIGGLGNPKKLLKKAVK